MNATLAYLRGRRAWLVENLTVWGADSEAELHLAISETVGSDNRFGYWNVTLEGSRQEVAFSDLSDNRGNPLPQQIKKPAVIVIPRGKTGAFLKSVLGETGFIIARSDDNNPSTTVDLMIFETDG